MKVMTQPKNSTQAHVVPSLIGKQKIRISVVTVKKECVSILFAKLWISISTPGRHNTLAFSAKAKKKKVRRKTKVCNFESNAVASSKMVSRLSSRLQSLWPTLKRSSLSPLKHTFQTQASHLCLYKTHFSHLTVTNFKNTFLYFPLF